jgi:hypothetical protein
MGKGNGKKCTIQIDGQHKKYSTSLIIEEISIKIGCKFLSFRSINCNKGNLLVGEGILKMRDMRNLCSFLVLLKTTA